MTINALDPLSLRVDEWLDTYGLPKHHEESWKYTPIDILARQLETTSPAEETSIDGDRLKSLAADLGGTRLVFVNGFFQEQLSTIEKVDGLEITVGPRPNDSASLISLDARYDGYQAINALANTDATTIEVGSGVQVSEPVHVVNIAIGADTATIVNPRTVVTAGADSYLQIVETFASEGEALFVNSCTTFEVAERASISYERIQTEGLDTYHVGHTKVRQGAESKFSSISVALGGKIARAALDVTIDGDHAETLLDGAYLPIGTQRHDNMLTLDHAASYGNSNQNYKGAIGGKARGSFSGHVIVRENTVNNNADQSNGNLLLASSAQADTRPWLEIFADEVACSHGATVGRLDDEALFYLRSRAIPLYDARTMLITAFIHEITDKLTPLALQQHLVDSIDSRLEDHS